MTVAILSLLVSGALSLFTQPFAAAREDETIGRLIALKRAIVGDPRIVTREARTDFGFHGDTGSLPATLDELWILGALPTFSFDTNIKMGAGWAGPYVQVPPLDLFDDISRDAWGTDIQYVVGTEVSQTTGQTVRAKLISYGRDTASGGGDDFTVEIYETEMLSDVVGFIRDAVGNPLPGVTTKIYGSSAEFVGKTVFHRRLRRPRCSPSLKASLASSAAAPALTLGCAPRCRLVWAMGNGASGGGSGHRV